ncbi:hypothetical protein [Oceanispirochaeta sp.]|uniref:LA_2272 family surface repeat-containing protein n=1 Tax=Oceanispirochaeta sp. TaxID=2035350 RepID=UPI002608C500|nr:hypothetical protein [Oceanispirochaeta sp.]MDA3958288.1 hypothetical protein [Oceanispirochaeta sp.]
MNKKTRLSFLVLIVMITVSLSAEDAEKSRAGQVTFFYPMGTNGTESMEYTNSFSLNMVYGMNGGVDAFELGGVGNFNTHDVSGMQIAGVSNINMEETRGFQFAGVSNTNFGDSTGLIWSGTLNSVFGDSKGVLVSTINVTTGEMRGLQVGTLNYAARSKGIQLGVINVAAEGSDSLPIGLISIIKGGYYAIEASAGEALYGNLSYKMGVERFYTIFKIGGSLVDGPSFIEGDTFDKNDLILSYGLGWGSLIPLSGHNKLAIEVSSSKIVSNNNWDNEDEEVNFLNKLDINCHIGLGDHLSIFAGPSFNVYVADEIMGDEEGSLPIPYTFFDESYEGTQVQMWVGGNVGITYSF